MMTTKGYPTVISMDSNKDRANAELFKARLMEKIQALLDEFAEGKISREQFHLLYERYSERLEIVESGLLTGDYQALEDAQDGPSTMQVKAESSARAVGLVIYHNARGTLVETLGTFAVAPERVLPVLLAFSRSPADRTEPRVEQVSAQQWLLFAAGTYTTIVTLFHNEPSKQQIRAIERLHRDFENANRASFLSGQVDAEKLAYPFIVFVQQKLKGG